MKGNYRWIRLPFTDNDHQALYYSEKSDTVYIHDSKKMSTYKVLDDGELKHHAIEPGMPEPPTENKVDRPANDVSMSEMRDAFRDINKRNEGIDPTVLENHRKMIAEYYEKYPKDPKKNPTDIAVNKARRAGAPLSFRSLEEIVEIVNRAIRAVREERGANSHGLDRDVMRLYLDEENTLLHERSRELFDMLRRLPRIAKWAQMKPREAPFSSLEQEAIQKVSELLGPAVEKSDGDDPNKDSEVKRLLYALGGALTPAAIQKGEDCAKDAAGTIISTIGSLFTDKNGNTFKLNYAGEDFVLEPFEPLNDEEAESHEQIVETSAGVSKAILETSHASYEQPTVIEGMKALNERVQEFIDLIGEEKGRKEIIRVLYKERMNNKSKTGYKFVFSETEPNKIVLTGASGKMGVATNDATGEVILYPVEVPPSGVKLMRIFL